jgi:hypothetical protein
MDAVNKALTTADAEEKTLVNHWLHPSALQNLGWLDEIKAEAAKAKAALEADAKKAEVVAKKDWHTVSTDLMLAGQKCGTNQICQELATYGINASEKLEAKTVHKWMTEGKYGKWCSTNNICMEAVQKALLTGDKVEENLVNHWLHPSALQNLGWLDEIKAEAAKAKAALEADAKKAEVVAKKDWHTVSTDLMLAGQKCGTNQICQELATYGINASEKLEAKTVHKWMTEGKYGKWCSTNNICMEAVQKALLTGDKVEENLINKWLHPSTTIMMI